MGFLLFFLVLYQETSTPYPMGVPSLKGHLLPESYYPWNQMLPNNKLYSIFSTLCTSCTPERPWYLP